MEDSPSFEELFSSDSDEEACGPGERHNPEGVIKRNAAFLIESSIKIPSYDQEVLGEMRNAFALEDFEHVVDLAYRHDRRWRGAPSLFTKKELDTPFLRFSKFMGNLLSLLDK